MATIAPPSRGPQNGLADQRKTFRTKRDAEDWARRTEDEMVRGVYILRISAHRDRSFR
ncbi:integrase [Pseudomonas aeruginosa]|uniref:integrase n=1 Tax=Pseudomonas aeruginosa TaxID=287 RepID=UPI003F5802D9